MQKFLEYRPAHIVAGKQNYYIAYSVINPETGKLTVKRVKLNYIKEKRLRKQYAEELIKQINANLAAGFNPFFSDSTDKLILLSDAIAQFMRKIRADLDKKLIKEATFDDYNSQLKRFAAWLDSDLFLYKIHKTQISAFLDYLYIDKKLTAYTRNHYLQTLRTFFSWCVSKELVKENPAKEIANERNAPKRRAPIPDDVLKKIFGFLSQDQKYRYYYLACQLLYSCFIRPSEICGLKIGNINFANQTIFIPAAISKNKKDQTVTMPQNVAEMLLDLKIYNFPNSFFIVGRGLVPSDCATSAAHLREIWGNIRKKLKFSNAYQFYSLKDSGITRMINLLDVRQVRDQARHSSISITDAYTARCQDKGNDTIKRIDFSI